MRKRKKNEAVKKTIVNSWNEWDPLKHVIVGVADGCMIPPSEPAVECKVPNDSDMKGKWGPRPQETVDKANIQLDNLSGSSQKKGHSCRPAHAAGFQPTDSDTGLGKSLDVRLYAAAGRGCNRRK